MNLFIDDSMSRQSASHSVHQQKQPLACREEHASAASDSQLDQTQPKRTAQKLFSSDETPPSLTAEAAALLSALAAHIELIASRASPDSCSLPALLDSNFGNEVRLIYTTFFMNSKF